MWSLDGEELVIFLKLPDSWVVRTGSDWVLGEILSDWNKSQECSPQYSYWPGQPHVNCPKKEKREEMKILFDKNTLVL